MANIGGCAKDALKVLGKKYAKADPSKKRSYTNVMDGVRRIIPRD
jgi:hypothetical protein